MAGLLRLLVPLVLLAAALPAAAQSVVADNVSAEATETASQPKIARDGRGGLHLALVVPVRGVDQVFVASSDDNGRSWRLTQVTTRSAPSRYPTLAAGRDGRLHLAWTTYEPIGHVYYAQRAADNWSAPRKISPGDAYAGVPAIAVDAWGMPHLVWYGIRNQAPPVLTRHGSIYEILYSGQEGSRWTTPIVISPGIPDSINPALAADAAGDVHSAWYQFDIQAYQARYVRRRGGRWGAPEQVSAGNRDAVAVALAVHPDGRAYLVWERRGAVPEVYFAERLDRWSGQRAISPSGQPAAHPAVAVDTQDRVHVVWESDGRIQLRRRDRHWQGVETLDAEGTNTHPIVAATGETIDMMWTQAVGGRHRVRFATLGPRGGPSLDQRRPAWTAVILILLAAGLLWQWRRRGAVIRR
ncbi:MAG TPA: sialidase family protein [bacterium]|nr:sialidase family protein [bacterium]